LEKLITIQEAAKILQVSKYTIKRWLKTGKLYGSKVSGTHWKVFLSSCSESIDKWSNKCQK
jgi:excisionase family DNA binding protein